MKILILASDFGGCTLYRGRQPAQELKRFGADTTIIFALPAGPHKSLFTTLYEFISQFDLIMIQRCPKLALLQPIRDICDILGKPLIFDTDDDYFNVEKTNPSYYMFGTEEHRENYKTLLGMVDAVTVSTQELADLYYPHNRNIYVLPNNVEYIPCGEHGSPKRDIQELRVDSKSKPIIQHENGMAVVPAYFKKNGEIIRQIRIGYTGTESHKADFETIKYQLAKISKKYKERVWLIMIGDIYFYNALLKEGCQQLIHIPIVTHHDQYLNYVRNIDIGLAPLLRTISNMGRSPIKAMEYAQWGVPAVLPNYITYTREFEHNKNCLMYNNSMEFSERIETLINNDQLREELGTAARDHIRDFRLERDHARHRYELYQKFIDSIQRPKRFVGINNEH